jgi:anti-sigma B factor antagonist
MNIISEKISNYSILHIDGRIDTLNAPKLEVEMDQLHINGELIIIINCRDLKYISSSGLRVFLNAQKKAITSKRKLYLCNMQPAIQEIFDISGFSSIFSIYGTLEEALNS